MQMAVTRACVYRTRVQIDRCVETTVNSEECRMQMAVTRACVWRTRVRTDLSAECIVNTDMFKMILAATFVNARFRPLKVHPYVKYCVQNNSLYLLIYSFLMLALCFTEVRSIYDRVFVFSSVSTYKLQQVLSVWL